MKKFNIIISILILILISSFASAEITDKLLTHYNFEQTGSSQLIDVFNGDSNSTSVTGIEKNKTGIIGKAWGNNTRGTARGVDIPVNSFPLGNTDRTIKIWIKDYTSTGQGNSVYYGYGNNAGTNYQAWEMMSQTDNKIHWANYFQDITSSINRETNTWRMITFTWNGTSKNLSIYLNETLATSVIQANAIDISTTNPFGIWMDAIGGRTGLDFDADEMTIWNRSLSQAEINGLYLNESNGIGYNNNSWNGSGENPPLINTTSLFFQGQTPNNSSAQYYLSNNNVTIMTNATFFGGIVNTTIYLYNSTGLYLAQSKVETNTTSLFNTTFTGLPIGTYRFNATATNGSITNRTSQITFFIYNLTTNGINTPTNNQVLATQFFNFTWNATTITPTATGVTISAYNVSLRNTDGSLNRSIVSTTNTSFNYNLYEQNLSIGAYKVRVQSIDSNANSQSQETSFNLSTNTLLNITAKSITGATINTFSINAYNSLYNYNITINTTNGVAYVNQIRGLINLSIDADGFALNSNNSLASINVVAQNYSYQFTLYQTNTMNFTFYNQSDNKIMSINVTFDLIGSLSAYTNLTTNGNIILPLITPDDYTMRYTSAGFATRFYRLTVTNRSYQNIDLYLINNNVAYNWSVFVVNEVLNPVEGATVKNLKYNLATNEYLLQEIGVTDIAGKTRFAVTFNDEYYKQIVEYPSGTLRKVTIPDYIDSASITIPITLGDNNIIEGLINYDGIGAIFAFNNVTNNFRFDWTDTNQIASQYCVTIYNVSLLYGQVVYNSSCVSGASAGSVLLGVHNQSGLTYYGRITYYEGGVQKYLTSLYKSYPLSLVDDPLGNKYGLFIQMILTIGITSLVVLNIGLAMILAPFSLILGKILGWNVFSWVGLFALQVVGIILAIMASMRK